MAIKAKIDYPAVDTVRVEVAHPDGEPRVIIRKNRFQAVVDAARAINGATSFTTAEPIAPSGDDKYIKTLRKAVAFNERANELLDAPRIETFDESQFDKLVAITGKVTPTFELLDKE